MNQCSAPEMRKNLQVVDQLKKAGIDFVCIPCKDSDHKNELINMGNEIFEAMLEVAEVKG